MMMMMMLKALPSLSSVGKPEECAAFSPSPGAAPGRGAGALPPLRSGPGRGGPAPRAAPLPLTASGAFSPKKYVCVCVGGVLPPARGSPGLAPHPLPVPSWHPIFCCSEQVFWQCKMLREVCGSKCCFKRIALLQITPSS